MSAALATTLVCALAAFLTARSAEGRDLKDLHFGVAAYYAHQERYFDALERLDAEIAQHYGVDEPQLDSLHHHIDQAEFSVGDFELHYRMHHRAGRAIKAVLEADVDDAVRNEAAYPPRTSGTTSNSSARTSTWPPADQTRPSTYFGRFRARRS
jgi:uncharacterized protein HemX